MRLPVLVARLAVAGLLALTCTAATRGPAPEPLPLTNLLRSRLDALVAAATGSEPGDAPAVAVAFVADGKLAYEGTAGFANLAAGLPATAGTRFRIGSITKMFTAVAVLQLVQQHALELDDKLARYLRWAPHTDEITIRELLMHTSGVPNYLDDAFAAGSVETQATPRALIETVAKRPLEFSPGTRYAYSNTGYVLLGLVVEALAGVPLAEYERAHIFEPARMHETDVGAVGPGVPPATGYQDQDGAPAQRFDASWLYADGDAVSTAGDVARFDIALMDGTLLGPQALAQMQAQPVATGAGDERYGLGLSIAPFGPLTLVGHHGGLPGYESDNELLPAKRSAIVVLSNAFTFRTSYLLSGVLATLFPTTFAATIAQVKAGIVEIAPGENPAVTASLRRFVDGLRRGSLDRSWLTGRMEAALGGPQLALAAAQLAPVGELQALIFRGKSARGQWTAYRYVGIFASGRMPFTFVLDQKGKVAGFWLY
jgi:CubicO group peptidase (beta-lactamase class C family)